MKESILFIKMIGEEKYREMINYTLLKIRNKFGNIKIDKAIDIEKINHQTLLSISILKAKGLTDNEIINILRLNRKNAYKFLVADSFYDFVNIYNEYMKLIIKFAKGR